MNINLRYAIQFVSDMDKAIKFYRDKLGLHLKMQSEKWTEFDTGNTILALHKTDDKAAAGTVQLGFNADNIDAWHARMLADGIVFTKDPEELHGIKLGEFLDSEGNRCSLSG